MTRSPNPDHPTSPERGGVDIPVTVEIDVSAYQLGWHDSDEGTTGRLESMDNPIADLCHWRTDLESDRTGEFWIDREALTQRMSNLSPTKRAFFKWGIVEAFNKGLEEILTQDQAVGEMREDFRDH